MAKRTRRFVTVFVRHHTRPGGNMNPLKELGEFGQSVWLDFIQRKLLTGGELKRMVEEDGLKGVTSNPRSSRRPSRTVTTMMT